MILDNLGQPTSLYRLSTSLRCVPFRLMRRLKHARLDTREDDPIS
jgi:hypothetical protein